MKWSDVLLLDLYQNVGCEWCKKNMIVKEARIMGPDTNNIYLLCGFCYLYEDWSKVLEAYNEDLMKRWTGLEPLPINYI